MVFPFTFKLSVPGLFNPFSAANSASNAAPKPPVASLNIIENRSLISNPERPARRRPSPSLSPVPQIPRKRGWEPTFAEPSQTATTLASTSGYLDTPAKYRDMAVASSNASTDDFHEIDSSLAEMPPTKRRRGLAGSIVSGALSAALIGAAVGVTVYRLWRDHGKEPEQIAPPPYQEAEWASADPPEQPKSITVTPPTPRGRKSRHTAGSAARRAHRKHRPRVHGASPPPHHGSSAIFPPVPAHFDFEQERPEEQTVEDKMDWIGDKLSMLIEEGKKALGREVVVMSETVEDEIDDGNGSWEEEDDDVQQQTSLSRSASPRRKRQRQPHRIALPPPSYPYASHPSSASPRSTKFDFEVSAPMAIPMSMPSTSRSSPVASFKEDPSSWASPELRESMERARALAMKNRGL